MSLREAYQLHRGCRVGTDERGQCPFAKLTSFTAVAGSGPAKLGSEPQARSATPPSNSGLFHIFIPQYSAGRAE